MEMISYFSKIIASFLYQRKIISKNELTVCEYGFELIIFTGVSLQMSVFHHYRHSIAITKIIKTKKY